MSQVVEPRWLTNTWRASFFYNSYRTRFIEIIEAMQQDLDSDKNLVNPV